MHYFLQNKKMSQKVIQQENSQKNVFLSQGSFQGEINVIVKSASQASQIASQGQVLTHSRTTQNVSSQDSVSTQGNASSQPVVPTLSQLSSQKSVPSQNRSQLDEKENIDQSEIDFAKAEYSRALHRVPSQNSQDLKNSSWLLRSGQSDSQGRDYLTSCTELLLNEKNPTIQKS